MVRKYECPRCGAGTNPADSQCWRCGEMLNAKPMLEEPETRIAAAEDAIGESSLVVLSRDEKKSQSKKALSKNIRDVEEREKALQEREKRLAQREKEVEGLAVKVEKGIKTLEGGQTTVKEAGQSQDLKKLLEMRDGYKEVIEQEKARLKNQIQTELDSEMKRVEQLEDQLKRIYADKGPDGPIGGRKEVPPSSSIKGIIAEVAELVKPQIGAGFDAKLNQRRIFTHLDKLDQILGGGVPEGSVVLVNGPAGSMKSTLCFNVLHQCAIKDDIKSMYLSLDQNRESLVRQMEKMGLKHSESSDNMAVADIVDLRKRMADEHGDWRTILTKYIKNVYDEMHFDLLVLDSLESYAAMTEHPLSREDMHDLFEWIRSLQLTAFLISEKPFQSLVSERHTELYVADGAIELMMKETGDSKVQRWLRCVKMRGENIDTHYYCLMHDNGKFTLSIPLMRSLGF